MQRGRGANCAHWIDGRSVNGCQGGVEAEAVKQLELCRRFLETGWMGLWANRAAGRCPCPAQGLDWMSLKVPLTRTSCGFNEQRIKKRGKAGSSNSVRLSPA